jgi:glycerol-3-phosphate acyltransferase PlsX
MAGALLILGRLPGIERPALGALFPGVKTPPPLLLDVGANTDCKPEYLFQFAQMGSIYAERVQGISMPRVALLANGEESSKGDKRVQEAHLLMLESDLHFAGNVEPKDLLMSHEYDVVVSDGFIGNLMLKMGEATVSFVSKKTKEALLQQLTLRVLLGLAPAAALTLLPGSGRWRAVAGALLGSAGLAGAGIYPLVQMRRKMDYRVYGGVPLLGVKGVVVIAHGRSDALAVSSAIRRAKETVESRTVQTIAEAVSVPAAPAAPAAPRMPARVLE